MAEGRIVNKYALPFSDEDWNKIFNYVKKRPQILFHDKSIRIDVAMKRAEYFRKLEESSTPEGVIDWAVKYNSSMMQRFIESHFPRLLYPLSMIDPLYENRGSSTILSVGPRNEMELLAMLALGFSPGNIKAIDLVSNSPLVDVGDMHHLPYPDSSFDAVMHSWVLLYSRTQQRSIDELVRVVKPNGLIAIGMTRVPPDSEVTETWVGDDGSLPNYLSCDEVLRFFGDHVAEIPYRHEPLDKTRKGALMLIIRVKK